MRSLDVLSVSKLEVWPERGTERDAEETEKVLMRTSQEGNKEDVI